MLRNPPTLSLSHSSLLSASLNGIEKDEPCSDTSQSHALDRAISKDARHQAVQTNIRLRRYDSFRLTTPMFTDRNSKASKECNAKIDLPNAVFGPGHCGLQATFQAPSKVEILMLYDQLIPLVLSSSL